MGRKRAKASDSAGKPGPKPKPASERQSATLLTYWRPDQLDEVRNCAKLQGLSTNAFVCAAALRSARRTLSKRPTEPQPEPTEEPSEPQPPRWQPPEHRRRPK